MAPRLRPIREPPWFVLALDPPSGSPGIMFGLSFAAVLSLLLTPVMYAIFFSVHPGDPSPPSRTASRPWLIPDRGGLVPRNELPARPTVCGLARSAWQEYRRGWPAFVVFEGAFKLAQAVLVVPLVSAALAAALAASGRVAVSNWDILDFLVAPAGAAYAVMFVAFAACSFLAEQAGVMALAAATSGRLLTGNAFRVAIPTLLRIGRLGAVKVLLLSLTAVPFVLLAVITYAALLAAHDIYFYVTTRPPAFWLAAGVGGVLLAAAATACTVLYLRWSLALPILLYEGRPAREALRLSRERVSGAGWLVGRVLLGWQVVALLTGTILLAGFQVVAEGVLRQAGETPVALTLLLLVGQGALLAMWTFAVVVGHSLLTRQLYLALNSPNGRPAPAVEAATPVWVRRLAYVSFALAFVGPVSLGLQVRQYLKSRPPVGVTAHRGHARAAPENTLSAVLKAIESGADYAEVDAQLTADGVIVLLHDRDFMRVAGDPRRLADLRYDEVRSLDVGTWFGPAFAGERVPSLADVIRLARGRIRLNIELKGADPDRRLAAAVAELIRAEHVEGETLVTSFDLEALEVVRRIAPGVRTGLIVAQALGDISRLDVDVLNVRADHLTDALLRAARRRGMEVHAWTVNDPPQMLNLMKRGVDNILTSDPDLLIRVRGEWQALSGGERLVLAARLLLGLDPEASRERP